MKTKSTSIALLVLAGLITSTVTANAVTTFNIKYSGASFGNNASAVGTITLNDSVLTQLNPNYNTSVVGLSLTISGASSGNGTFTASDFSSWYWNTAGTSLDYSKDLVGQTLQNGGKWGDNPILSTTFGDFNLFASGNNQNAPIGTWFFTLTTNGHSGDQMKLTNFTSGTPVPEPSTYGLIGLGALGVAFVARRRKVKTA